MKTVSLQIVALVIGTFGLPILAQTSNSVEATQIISIDGGSFRLDVDGLKQVFGTEDMKDRHVIVVSIAGPYRTGKSFLLSLFLKYLYAKYKTHDSSKWLKGNINGYFEWRYGRERTTKGIWMWPEIFTYDFDANNRVAIIIIDSQGIFDHKTTTAESTKIFALTLMMSSVQCYNLMNNIQEDDLQHLEYFTEYGRNALGSTGEKPFQQLLFIVRDWAYGDVTPYGMSRKIVDEVLLEDEDQAEELVNLRRNIKSSFGEIDSFLMPSPGEAVKGKNFSGDISEISTNFQYYTNELVSLLFDPENLKVKTVNGVKIRARNMVEMLENYVELFNGNTLPQPQSIVQMQLELQYGWILANAVELYVKTMETYCVTEICSEEKFRDLHRVAKAASLQQLSTQRRSNDGGKLETFQLKLHFQIEEKLKMFEIKNTNALEKHLTNLLEESERKYTIAMEEKMLDKSYDTNDFYNLYNNEKQTAMKMFRDKVEYTNKVHDESRNLSTVGLQSNNEPGGITQLTQNIQEQKVASKALAYELRFSENIDSKFQELKQRNEDKYENDLNALEKHLANLVEESERKYTNSMEEKILQKSYDPNDFYNLHNSEKQTAMKLFRDRVRSTDNTSAGEFQLNFRAPGSVPKTQLTQNFQKQVASKASTYELRLSEGIDSKYQELEQRNENKYENDLIALENHYANLVEESEQKYSNELEEKMLEKSYDTNDFYNLHINVKQTTMQLFRDKVRSTNGANAQTGGFQFNRKTGSISAPKAQLTQNLQQQKVASKATAYELQLSERIDSKYKELEQRNEVKYANYVIALEKYLTNLVEESERKYISIMEEKILEISYEKNDFYNIHNSEKHTAMKSFRDKVGLVNSGANDSSSTTTSGFQLNLTTEAASLHVLTTQLTQNFLKQLASKATVYELLLSKRIESKYQDLEQRNEAKYENYVISLENHYTNLVKESEQKYFNAMEEKMRNESYTANDFNDQHYGEKQTAMKLFRDKVSTFYNGTNESKASTHELRLSESIDSKYQELKQRNEVKYENDSIALDKHFTDHVKASARKYSNAMQQKMLQKSYGTNDFYNIHNNAKQEAMKLFRDKATSYNGTNKSHNSSTVGLQRKANETGGSVLTSQYQQKMASEASAHELRLSESIDCKYQELKQINEVKYANDSMMLEINYTNLVEESEQKYFNAMEKKMRNESYTANDFNDLHYGEKQTAMKLFRDKVRTFNNGTNESKASTHELRLSESIDSKYQELEQRNKAKYANDSVYGKFCVTFNNANAKNVDCDTEGSCDIFVKMYVNGKYVFITKTHTDNDHPVFGETYCNYMKKDAALKIEVWDSDDYFMGVDDLIHTFNVHPLQNLTLTGSGVTLNISQSWIPIHK